MWSFPVAVVRPERGLLVRVSVVLVTKLFLGKNALSPPSSFHKETPSMGMVKAARTHYIHSKCLIVLP